LHYKELVELTTSRLRLREQSEADALAAHSYESDPEVVRFQSHGVRTVKESLAYIRKVLAEQAEDPRRLWDLAIEAHDDRRMIGRVGFLVTRPDDGEATLWYVLSRELWGQGYVTEAARALLDFGFGALGLHRVFVDSLIFAILRREWPPFGGNGRSDNEP
jgi:RimJ/RimL family protein N-acetyltransferase